MVQANHIVGILFAITVIGSIILYRCGVAAATIIAYKEAARLNALKRARREAEAAEEGEAAPALGGQPPGEPPAG